MPEKPDSIYEVLGNLKAGLLDADFTIKSNLYRKEKKK